MLLHINSFNFIVKFFRPTLGKCVANFFVKAKSKFYNFVFHHFLHLWQSWIFIRHQFSSIIKTENIINRVSAHNFINSVVLPNIYDSYWFWCLQPARTKNCRKLHKNNEYDNTIIRMNKELSKFYGKCRKLKQKFISSTTSHFY